MHAISITRALHSRGVAVLAAVLAIIAAWCAYSSGDILQLQGERGFALPSISEWIPAGLFNFAVGLLINSAVVLLAVLINNVYNILHGISSLHITLFAIMQATTPQVLSQFYSGPILALVVMLGLYILFANYQSSNASAAAFLVFLLLSGFTISQYCFGFFIPIFLVICTQVRIFNARTIIAAILGILTPWWIFLGFGIIQAPDLHLPNIHSIFIQTDFGDMLWAIITSGITVLVLILCVALNIFKAIAYNARNRAINGAITVMAIFTVLVACIDITNLPAYIPLLNICAAIQSAHYFSTHRSERSFIAILLVIAVYIAIYVCQILI